MPGEGSRDSQPALASEILGEDSQDWTESRDREVRSQAPPPDSQPALGSEILGDDSHNRYHVPTESRDREARSQAPPPESQTSISGAIVGEESPSSSQDTTAGVEFPSSPPIRWVSRPSEKSRSSSQDSTVTNPPSSPPVLAPQSGEESLEPGEIPDSRPASPSPEAYTRSSAGKLRKGGTSGSSSHS